METQAIKDKITEEFYWFHKHPELSYEEYETTARIKENLTVAGIRIINVPLKTGLIAEVGSGKKPILAIRCDIDALPIQEKTDLTYQSQIPGKMHACGHDFHTATVLGVAYLLKQREAALNGTVRIIFQPAEEAPGGAVTILETGALQDVQAIFGIHSSSLFEVGTVGIKAGAVTAAVDRFNITYTGKGTHAAHPQNGIDPIVTAAAFVSSVQSIISRNMDPFSPALLSITHFESGTTWNVIPETAYLEGTVRTLVPQDRVIMQERLHTLAKNIATAYGAEAAIQWISGPPATANDAAWASFAAAAAAKRGLQVEVSPNSLGGEDFAFYQEKIRGVFIQIGTGKSYPNHNPHFRVDPAALFPAAEYVADLAEQALVQI